jgi:hypothetical protein
MLRLDRVIKPWKESGALNAHINLFGFWNETTFLTKSGDLGMVMRVSGTSTMNRSTTLRIKTSANGNGKGKRGPKHLLRART